VFAHVFAFGAHVGIEFEGLDVNLDRYRFANLSERLQE
jgi:hypothetical protein